MTEKMIFSCYQLAAVVFMYFMMPTILDKTTLTKI